ncbi:hypothetical protein OE88DRAFT_794916 [Heliocybe sulcata]|uniref:Uncharacterized protein n=1 Tax=Heliocybe sulcata TaxID=5364 RepID=A0A5C3MR98_9AGAM|nr:hypothetical protein OE88DRAFT_794916 [Heliocybe sulcata]
MRQYSVRATFLETGRSVLLVQTPDLSQILLSQHPTQEAKMDITHDAKTVFLSGINTEVPSKLHGSQAVPCALITLLPQAFACLRTRHSGAVPRDQHTIHRKPGKQAQTTVLSVPSCLGAPRINRHHALIAHTGTWLRLSSLLGFVAVSVWHGDSPVQPSHQDQRQSQPAFSRTPLQGTRTAS